MQLYMYQGFSLVLFDKWPFPLYDHLSIRRGLETTATSLQWLFIILFLFLGWECTRGILMELLIYKNTTNIHKMSVILIAKNDANHNH